MKPPLASAVVERFRKAFEDGLTLAAVLVVPGAETESTRLATIGACRTEACQRQLAGALKATYVLTPRVVRTGKNYRIACELFDPTGKIAIRQTSSCDICTLSEAVTKAQSVGQDVGIALLAKHRVLYPRPRPRPRIRPRPRVRPRPRARLLPRPRPQPKPKPRPKPKYRPKPSVKQAAWMSGVAGLLSTVAGVTLLAYHGRPTCDEPYGDVRCPYRYKTGTAGAVFTSLGGAAIVASVVLFYYGYSAAKKPERPRTTVGVTPTKGGVWAHASFRF
ncbi:MAG: hypothetical protein ABI333_29410 [bacterium]